MTTTAAAGPAGNTPKEAGGDRDPAALKGRETTKEERRTGGAEGDREAPRQAAGTAAIDTTENPTRPTKSPIR